MAGVLASSVVDRGFEPRSGQTKDYNIGICCFSTKHATLRRKRKDWLARNQGNVYEWGDMSIRGLLFQWASTIKLQLSVLVKYKAGLIIISLKINLFSPWYSWNFFNQQSLTHSFCWYWWNCWPSMYKRSCHNSKGLEYYVIDRLSFIW